MVGRGKRADAAPRRPVTRTVTRTVTTLAAALALLAWWPPSRVGGQDLAPLRNLPPPMRVLLDWGVRPEWSLDVTSLLFMSGGSETRIASTSRPGA
jgi:hypothetical protein